MNTCHFLYSSPSGGQGGDLLLAGSDGVLPSNTVSPVGAGGRDISNGFCTIHAATSQVTAEPYVLKMVLDIDFTTFAPWKMHVYSLVGNRGGSFDYGPYYNWNYWGWWATRATP